MISYLYFHCSEAIYFSSPEPIGLELWFLWQLIVAIDLQGEKWKLAFIAILLQTFFYRNIRGMRGLITSYCPKNIKSKKIYSCFW